MRNIRKRDASRSLRAEDIITKKTIKGYIDRETYKDISEAPKGGKNARVVTWVVWCEVYRMHCALLAQHLV